jgi:hypothetical protein
LDNLDFFVPVYRAPGSFSATALSTSQIKLTWSDPAPDETGFTLETSSDGGSSWSPLANPSANATSYTVTGLPNAATRSYRIKTTYSSGGSAWASSSATTLGYTPMQQWRVDHFSSPDNTGPAADVADPDGDGLVNLLEYALGGTPTEATSTPLPTASLLPAPNSTLTLTFKRARPAAELTYTVQASSDLATWTDLEVNPGTVGQNVTVTDSPPAGATRRFLRLRVTLP